ncbi:TetR/AcrR family transcriptional regulator [Spongiactinospora sp. TRM90649]|uniref:TetR/AcrR family transcriptional regulator n=1 Tax=Spongiactinospora sp. TRM90649 TaxID=3031114 RepID=UPI0023F6C2CC|nr:TetR/AcrR family transcriptional regulator [Spongiactinospora sp. TRM90649]MDF5752204.1 TetR/AcrR family transcriptional regulator [Spongiactinospora sp. TRM90649]
MGNREDLLAGARQCLAEKGYGRTTVRDIAAAAGVSMAAIGYHFGSREALLNAALSQTIDELDGEYARAFAAYRRSGSPDGLLAMWRELAESVREHPDLWTATVEAWLEAAHSPDLRTEDADRGHRTRRAFAAALTGTDEATVPDQATRTIGAVQTALLTGALVQWLTDPERAPTPEDLIEGLTALTHLAKP